MNYIPHRYTAKSVYRFVPVINSVLTQHKARGVARASFSPLDMNIATETAIARLRDAVHSLSSGMTTHPSIDAETLRQVWPLYKVTSDGINVLVVARTAEQGEPVTIHADSRDVLATLRVEDTKFVETLFAFALLLGLRLLQGQVAIHGSLSDSMRHRLESEHDVAITQDGPQQYHML